MPDVGKEKRSRFEILKGTEAAELPSLDWGGHLIESLLEFGPSMPTGSGPAPVSFTEIDAWMRATRTDVPGYEALILRQLSREYCDQYHRSSAQDCPMPVCDDVERTAKVSKSFAALVKQQKANTYDKHHSRKPRRR